MESEDATPSLAQAQRMKKLSQAGQLDMDTIFAIMTEEKGNPYIAPPPDSCGQTGTYP